MSKRKNKAQNFVEIDGKLIKVSKHEETKKRVNERERRQLERAHASKHN